jgi:hypothetical protein
MDRTGEASNPTPKLDGFLMVMPTSSNSMIEKIRDTQLHLMQSICLVTYEARIRLFAGVPVSDTARIPYTARILPIRIPYVSNKFRIKKNEKNYRYVSDTDGILD